MKIYNLIKTSVLAVGLLFSFSSCEDYLDINENPNFPVDGTLGTLLPSVTTTTISQIGLNGYLIGNMWMQYTTQGNTTNQYNTLVNYNLTVSDYNNFWTNGYANTLQDIKFLLEKAEKEDAWNYWVIGKVLMAYNYHILTDLYGDIPFTQALNAEEYPYPIYDDSKTVVYPGILAILDEAIAKHADGKSSTYNSTSIKSEDFYFGGDIDLWISFAKSLKFKLLMRDFEANRTQISAMLTEGGLLETDCAYTGFDDTAYKGNPFYEYNIRLLNTRENVRACHTFTEFLIANEDPRIAEYYEESNYSKTLENPTLRQIYGGLPCGTKPSSVETDHDGVPLTHSSRFKQSYDDPVYLMNNAEVAFMRAEAYARLGDAANAKTAYDEGVTKAFARWGYDASEHIAAGGHYEFNSSSTEAMIKSIITQKWVAAAKANSWDAFFDRNRTGYPEISSAEKVRVSNVTEGLVEGYELGTLVAPGSTVLQPMDFPQRILVPERSSAYNPNASVTESITTPMWWHKN